jgi:hypothetical protein
VVSAEFGRLFADSHLSLAYRLQRAGGIVRLVRCRAWKRGDSVHSGDASVCVAEYVIQVAPALHCGESLRVGFPGLAEVELVPDVRLYFDSRLPEVS